MAAPNGIAAHDDVRGSLRASIRDLAGTFSLPALTWIAAIALCTAWAVARFAPRWWLAGVLALAIAAAALAGVADRRITILRDLTPSRRATMLAPLTVLRLFSAIVAVVALVVFVMIGAALLMGISGTGG